MALVRHVGPKGHRVPVRVVPQVATLGEGRVHALHPDTGINKQVSRIGPIPLAVNGVGVVGFVDVEVGDELPADAAGVLDLEAVLPDGYSRILRSYMFGPSGFWTMAPLRYAAKFDPFLSLDCAPTPSTLCPQALQPGAIQGKEGFKFCFVA